MSVSGGVRPGFQLSRRAVLASGGALALAGCDGPQGAGSRPPATPGGPWLGGSLRVAQVGDVGTADGHLNAGYDSFWLAYDRLIAYDAQRRPQSMLAESWEVSPDARKVTLNLRKDVRFHTGRAFTSEDVKFNFARVQDKKLGAGSIARQAAWWNVETPDPHVVVLTSDRPRPSAFDLFEYFNMVDRETVEGPDAKSKAVGTGPFKLAEWSPGVQIRLVRNPDYWNAGRPYLDEVVVNISPDPLSLLAQLESGAVDVINRAQARDVVRLRNNRAYRAILNQNAPVYTATINTTLAPFDRKEVRQALNYAMDRKRFVKTVLRDITTPQVLPWPANSPAADPVKNAAYAFDLDKARYLLRQAGVTDLELEMIWISSYGDLKGFAEIYQGDLAKIGVRATLRPLEGNQWRDQQLRQTYKGINLTFTGPTHLDPVTLTELRNFSSKSNASGFKSPEYQALTDAIARETDPLLRRALFDRLNDFYLDQCFAIPISGHPTSLLTRSNVKGLGYTMHEAVNFTDAWIES